MARTNIRGTQVKDGDIYNIDIADGAAIAGTKVIPDFGSQQIATSGKIKLNDGSEAVGYVLTSDINGVGTWTEAVVGGVTTFEGRSGVVTSQIGDYTKDEVGLGNVDNTSDLLKPLSTATTDALALKLAKAGDTMTGKLIVDTNYNTTLDGQLHIKANIPVLTLEDDTTATGSGRNFAIVNNLTTVGTLKILSSATEGTEPSVSGLTFDGINNRIGMGTDAPDTKLHVVGSLKMVDGNQGADKVLTSDINGVASWQTASGGGDAYLANTQTFTGANTFSNALNAFTGDGSALTGLTKTQVGLANVDNTADIAKPVSTAQQTALDLKAPKLNPILTNGNETTQTLISGASISWDMNSGGFATVTLDINATMAAPTNLKNGGSYILIVKQDAIGSRTLAYDLVFKFPGGTAPTLSTTANAVDILTFLSDGTNLYGVAQEDFK